VAGVAGFCAAAAFDWVWQIGVIPMVAMLLAAVAIGAPRVSVGGDPARRRSARLLPRLVLVLAALPALWAIARPLATTQSVRSSQSAAARDDFHAALSDALTAQHLEPGAASPRLQRALLLEQLGDTARAASAISQAEIREPTNWRIWLVASRIATESDRPREALADYRRARALNPTSPIFRH
jgi:tetratricopeptide (TPR) repeat protein